MILTEGHDWKAVLGADAGLVRGLGHIPVFRIDDGHAVPIPSTFSASEHEV